VLFAKVANTLWRIYQRFTNNLGHPITNLSEGSQYPLIPCNKFARESQQPMAHLQKNCPNCTQRGNFCSIPLKKVKKVKNQQALNSYKNYQEVHLHPYHQQPISI
jgi:hypothetical protein